MFGRTAQRLFVSGRRNLFSKPPPALPSPPSLPRFYTRSSLPIPAAQLNAACSAMRCPSTMRRLLSVWSAPSPLARRLFSTSTPPPNSPNAPPNAPPKDPESNKNDKDRSLAINVITLIVFVFGLSYLMVPLYRIFCTMTGVAGDVQIKNQTLLDEIEAKRIAGYRPKRRFTVEFAAATAKDLPWSFVPLQKQIEVYPGDTALAFYMAKNETSAPITGVATYNVNPLKAGLYFNKIQCFCFEEQQLQPYEEIEMPVFFFIDPEVENDARFADVDKIILSYTFFPIEYGDTEEQKAAHAAFVSSLELQKPNALPPAAAASS